MLQSRLEVVICALGLLTATGALLDCRGEKAQEEAAAKGAPTRAAVKKSLEGLKPAVATLSGKFANLRKQIEAIPPDLPGFSEVRAKFYSAAEAFGVMGPKLDWLSARLDAASKPGKSDELASLAKDIDKTYAELAELDGLELQVLHEVLPFERIIQRAKEVGAEWYTRKLPTGFELRAEKGGLEQRLLEFIEDPKQKPNDASWFDFDRLLFSAGAEINREASEDQLQSVTEILKAYPSVKVKLGAHTDDSGPRAANKARSAERAAAVKKALTDAGVPPSRLESEGFGAEHPLCPANDSEACKSKNRRVSLLVTAK